jgi:Tfp pilus assembly protein PilV
MTRRPSTQAGRQDGFTLLEALIALLVTSFGMLAIAAFQGTLPGSSDLAKQRSEAVRLAQLKIEQLRAYEQVASDGAGNKFDYTSDVVSGSDTIGPSNGAYTTNTTYTRVWTVDNAGSDLQKWVRVRWPSACPPSAREHRRRGTSTFRTRRSASPTA